MDKPKRQPLVAILKTAAFETVSEHELPAEVLRFPECIELETPPMNPPATTAGFLPMARRFFRFQISDHRGFYREGDTYRISQ